MSTAPGAGAGMPGLDSFTLDAALGPLLVGGLVSTILYGITCTQTFIYYQHSMEDRWSLKLTVLILWIIDTLDVILNGHILYHYLVDNFANPLALAVPVWSLLIHVTVTAVSNFIIRGMFTLRVWRMSNQNGIICALIASVSLIDLVCSIVITAEAFDETFAGLQKLSTLFYLDFAAILVADLTIALALCFFLHTSRTGVRKTESLINILIMYTINTGLLTALNATAGLILFAVLPATLIYVAFYLQLSKLYVNAYLATLNARETLRDKTQLNDPVSINLSQLSRSHGTHSSPFASPVDMTSQDPTGVDKRSNPMAITVTTHIDEILEEDDFKHRKRWAQPNSPS